jgi:hypothetical protein
LVNLPEIDRLLYEAAIEPLAAAVLDYRLDLLKQRSHKLFGRNLALGDPHCSASHLGLIQISFHHFAGGMFIKCLKTEDSEGQRSEDRRRDQPIASFLEGITHADRMPSTDSTLPRRLVYLAFFGDSLRICEQPVTCLEKFDDTCGRGG